MENFNVYSDIAERTNGDIYIGVVGPVRTGKSSFISKFMTTSVLPLILDENERARATDEIPQGANGVGVMTTKPQFVPNRAVKLNIGEVEANLRLIDCVGYMISGATVGLTETGEERKVKTPWSEEDMSFSAAAEMGTKKVIREHSTVAVLMTTDGTIETGLTRANYIDAEEKAITELKATNKPFIIVINSKTPESEEVQRLKKSLEIKHNVTVLIMNVLNLNEENISQIFEGILKEFPVSKIDVNLPAFLTALPVSSQFISEVITELKEKTAGKKKINEFTDCLLFSNNEHFMESKSPSVKMANGTILYKLEPKEGLFYKVVSSEVGLEIKDELSLVSCLKELAENKIKFSEIKNAFEQAAAVGYGISNPVPDNLSLEEPEILKQGGRFGVKLKAIAPVYHIIRVDVETEVNPILGTEQQSEIMAKEMMGKFTENPKELWDTNIFGKSLSSLAMEGLEGKVNTMPETAKVKLRKTTGKIMNEAKGGIICILL